MAWSILLCLVHGNQKVQKEYPMAGCPLVCTPQVAILKVSTNPTPQVAILKVSPHTTTDHGPRPLHLLHAIAPMLSAAQVAQQQDWHGVKTPKDLKDLKTLNT